MRDLLRTLFNRRELFRAGGMAALVAGPQSATPAAAGKLQIGAKIYESIGVRPLINCRGTLTVISGSLELPEVRAAKDAGAQRESALAFDDATENVGHTGAASVSGLPAASSSCA